jgi:hypothetical protein
MKLQKVITHALPVLAIATLLFLAVAANAEEAAPTTDEKLVPLDIELPKPMFVGTPKNIRSANLEKQTGKKRPPFMAPEGAENLAFEKELSASDEEPIIGEIELITDGDKEGADGSYVEFGPGIQWVQIDLERQCEIYAVVFWHYHSQARVYHDVVIKTADDPDLIENVTTVYNNDHDNSSGLGVGKDQEYIETNDGRLVDAKRTKGRYVRLYSSGNTSNELNHMIEVEVWGKPLGN